jgi:predicted nucleic acid-binding protein
MQVVVSDTGPLHYLVLVDSIGILPRLFGSVCVQVSVRAELDRPETPALVRAWIAEQPAWLEVHQAPATEDTVLRPIHEGEREAIALAVAIHADLVLMDDRAGVTTARSLGLTVTGTLGLLTIEHEQGLVALVTVFERLKTTNFRYRQALMDALLARYPNKTDRIR